MRKAAISVAQTVEPHSLRTLLSSINPGKRLTSPLRTRTRQTPSRRSVRSMTSVDSAHMLRWPVRVVFMLALLGLAYPAALPFQEGGGTQTRSKYFAPPAQLVAIRAGRLFDSKTGTILNNQIILIEGERITDVGPSVRIPAQARLIDLSTSTVLPGMIDTHVHVNTGGETPAERALISLGKAQTD